MEEKEKGKVTTSTIARTVCLVITLANTVLTATGKNPLPIAENDAYNYITTAATIIAAIVAWWKNNSFTNVAVMADEYMNSLKKK